MLKTMMSSTSATPTPASRSPKTTARLARGISPTRAGCWREGVGWCAHDGIPVAFIAARAAVAAGSR